MVYLRGERMSVGEKSVVFLLGAGCSFDAAVPVSKVMIEKLEELLGRDHKETLYPLYCYVKHTMEYGNKLFDKNQDFNIESLLVTLHALNDHKRAILYPFVTGYTSDLKDYAGNRFENIPKLIDVIEKELPGWVTLTSYNRASYYKKFQDFQKDLNFALRIFSLNYDLCLEKNNLDCKIETGFVEDEPWDGNRFTQAEDDEKTAIYLYKLHGSIDWERKNDQLRRSDQHNIKPDVIFGTSMKLQAIDPYLFYLYEFRKYVLASELIIAIGYSFNDGHINDLIRQAMKSNYSIRIASVGPVENEVGERARIQGRIQVEGNADDRIIVVNSGARDFLERTLSIDYVGSLLPNSDLPF